MSTSPPYPSNIQISTSRQVTLPSRESEEMIGVRRDEVRRLKARVGRLKKRLKHPLADATTWAAAFFGIAVAAGLGLIGLVAIKGQTLRSWVVPAVWAVLAGALIMCLLCLMFGK